MLACLNHVIGSSRWTLNNCCWLLCLINVLGSGLDSLHELYLSSTPAKWSFPNRTKTDNSLEMGLCGELLKKISSFKACWTPGFSNNKVCKAVSCQPWLGKGMERGRLRCHRCLWFLKKCRRFFEVTWKLLQNCVSFQNSKNWLLYHFPQCFWISYNEHV